MKINVQDKQMDTMQAIMILQNLASRIDSEIHSNGDKFDYLERLDSKSLRDIAQLIDVLVGKIQ